MQNYNLLFFSQKSLIKNCTYFLKNVFLLIVFLSKHLSIYKTTREEDSIIVYNHFWWLLNIETLARLVTVNETSPLRTVNDKTGNGFSWDQSSTP